MKDDDLGVFNARARVLLLADIRWIKCGRNYYFTPFELYIVRTTQVQSCKFASRNDL